MSIAKVFVRLRRAGFQMSSRLQSGWYRRIWGMDLGEGLKLSRSVRLDRTNPKGIHIGDWTAVAFNASILSHDMQSNRHLDTRIGSHCFIGANSIILPGVTIGDHCVVGAGSVVMTDVPPHSVVSGNPARVVRSGITTGRWGITDARFLTVEAEAGRAARQPVMGGGARQLLTLPRERLLALVQGENADLGPEVLDLPLAECGIDSFGLINLRIGIETAVGRPLADADWQSLSSLSDLVGEGTPAPAPPAPAPPAHAPQAAPAAPEEAPLLDAGPPVQALPGGERRRYRINQPQMAMRGLGESWLMKEIGDIHWSTLTRDLKSSSSALSDSSGARLYATFTRVSWRASHPLVEFRESEPLVLESHLSRHGAAMFFSHLHGRGAVATLDVDVMSSFAKYGEAGVNTSLLKGQPVIPDDSGARVLDGLPEFASEYRALRASDPGPSLFECDYELLPPHDINGVGLLYFAAYPMIMELCLMRHAGRAAVADWSLVERDICYFANADPTEVLRFRLHHLEEVDGVMRYTASLARTSDGKIMALSRAAKRLVDLPPPGQPLAPRC